MTAMSTDYDPMLRCDLTESFIRTPSDLAACGSPEVVDAGIEFLIAAMVRVERYAAIMDTFMRDLHRAVARARLR